MSEDKNSQPKRINRSQFTSALIGGAIGVALVGGIVVPVMSQNQDQKIEQAVKKATTGQNNQASSNNNLSTRNVQQASLDVTTDVSSIVDEVGGAVVSVENMTRAQNTYDLFGFRFSTSGGRDSQDLETASEGSGVIYKVDGDNAYLVTNNHVIEGNDSLEVIMEDGKQVQAKVIGSDPWTDLAVLSIPSEDVKEVATFGDSASLKVGEPAIAIGSPLGSDFSTSVTTGIISGLNRQVPMDLNNDDQPDWTATAIQTDAAINPGNSGGALVNSAGQVVGINSMKITNTKVEGMGFAIPINEVKDIIKQLEENGRVIRPTLGIQMASLYQVSLEQQRSILKLPEEVENGVVITNVVNNSPASQAGLKVNDVIVSFDGKEVKDDLSLRQLLYSKEPKDKVKVEFYRDGKKQAVEIQLEAQQQ